MTSKSKGLLEELAMVVNDLYPWADRNPEDLEGKEVQEHKKLMQRAKRALKKFVETQ